MRLRRPAPAATAPMGPVAPLDEARPHGSMRRWPWGLAATLPTTARRVLAVPRAEAASEGAGGAPRAEPFHRAV